MTYAVRPFSKASLIIVTHEKGTVFIYNSIWVAEAANIRATLYKTTIFVSSKERYWQFVRKPANAIDSVKSCRAVKFL